MASSSAYPSAGEVEGERVITLEDAQAAIGASSDSEGSDGTVASIPSDDEGTDSGKSLDGQKKDKDDKDKHDGDGDASTSISASASASASVLTTKDIMEMMEAMTIEEIEDFHADYKSKAKTAIDNYKAIDKRLKKIKSDEKKELRRKELEQTRKEQKGEREKRITINVTMNSECKAVSVPSNATGAMFRDEVARAFNITVRKIIKSLRINFQNEDVLDHPRRTMAKAGMSDGCSCQAFVKGSGGGKRTRDTKETSSTKEDLATLMDFNIAAPEPKDSDTVFIRNAFNIKSVDIKEWLKSLPNAKVEELMKKIDDNDGKKANLKYTVAPFLEFITEHKSLQESGVLSSLNPPKK